MTGTSDDWVRRYHPRPDADIRLVCFPHAGSSAPYFHPVSATAGDRIDVLSVQYPGRQDRRQEPLIDTIDGLVDAAYPALRPWLDRPFAFFGHSMGATVAYELALRCEADGLRPMRLFASGRRAPSMNRDESIHRRDDDGLVAEMRSLSGTDSRVLEEEELIRMVLPALRNDYKAAETYVHRDRGRLGCPVTVLTGDDDPKVSVDEARAWSEHTSAPSTLHVYSGGHFFLAAHQPEVMDLIRRDLHGDDVVDRAVPAPVH